MTVWWPLGQDHSIPMIGFVTLRCEDEVLTKWVKKDGLWRPRDAEARNWMETVGC